MGVRWGDLAGVFVVSLGVTVVVVVMFSLGVAAWARAGCDGPRRVAPRTARERAAAVLALLCFASCLAVAGYAIDLIVPG
jgi:hypothetical protein